MKKSVELTVFFLKYCSSVYSFIVVGRHRVLSKYKEQAIGLLIGRSITMKKSVELAGGIFSLIMLVSNFYSVVIDFSINTRDSTIGIVAAAKHFAIVSFLLYTLHWCIYTY